MVVMDGTTEGEKIKNKEDDGEQKKRQISDDVVVFMTKRGETVPHYTARLKTLGDISRKRARAAASRKKSEQLREGRRGKDDKKGVDITERPGGKEENDDNRRAGSTRHGRHRSLSHSGSEAPSEKCGCMKKRRRRRSCGRRRRKRSCRRRRRSCGRRRRRRSRRRRRRSCRRRRRACRRRRR